MPYADWISCRGLTSDARRTQISSPKSNNHVGLSINASMRFKIHWNS